MMKRDSKGHVHRAVTSEAVRALASPVRQEIADCLSAGGPMSVRDVARELGRSPDGLYFHFQKLEEIGLVEVAGERKLARHTETLYRMPRELRLRYDVSDPGMREALAAMGSAMLRVARRNLLSGIDSERARSHGRDRNVWVARVVSWVTPAELARVNELLSELADTLSTARNESRTEKVSLVWSLAPVAVDEAPPT